MSFTIKPYKFVLILLAFSLPGTTSQSDTLLMHFAYSEDLDTLQKSEEKKNKNDEAHFLIQILFLTYQNLFSNQDGPTCTFKLSCSRYAKKAIHDFGLFQGSLMTTDRLIRCNGVHPELYMIDSESMKNIDPPENNNLW